MAGQKDVRADALNSGTSIRAERGRGAARFRAKLPVAF